jgi:hypothetical protein
MNDNDSVKSAYNGNAPGCSFANGNAPGLVQKTQRDSGWDIRSESHWSLTIGM